MLCLRVVRILSEPRNRPPPMSVPPRCGRTSTAFWYHCCHYIVIPFKIQLLCCLVHCMPPSSLKSFSHLVMGPSPRHMYTVLPSRPPDGPTSLSSPLSSRHLRTLASKPCHRTSKTN